MEAWHTHATYLRHSHKMCLFSLVSLSASDFSAHTKKVLLCHVEQFNTAPKLVCIHTKTSFSQLDYLLLVGSLLTICDYLNMPSGISSTFPKQLMKIFLSTAYESFLRQSSSTSLHLVHSHMHSFNKKTELSTYSISFCILSIHLPTK